MHFCLLSMEPRRMLAKPSDLKSSEMEPASFMLPIANSLGHALAQGYTVPSGLTHIHFVRQDVCAQSEDTGSPR